MTTVDDPDFKDRATARKAWPIRRFRLGKEPPENLSESTTAEERLAMVWQLTQDAWAMAGKPIPDYPREETPIHCVRSPVRTRDKGAD